MEFVQKSTIKAPDQGQCLSGVLILNFEKILNILVFPLLALNK